MLTEKTKTALYWILCVIGIGITIAAMLYNFDHRDNDWIQVAKTTGVAVILLGMLFEPITQKNLKNGTAGNKFYLAVFFAVMAAFWLLEIHQENYTLPIIIASVLDIILLIVLCWLAYKKKQRVKVLEEDLETARNEKNEV